MFSKGWWAALFAALMFAVMAWQCSKRDECKERGGRYLKDENVCVDAKALLETK